MITIKPTKKLMRLFDLINPIKDPCCMEVNNVYLAFYDAVEAENSGEPLSHLPSHYRNKDDNEALLQAATDVGLVWVDDAGRLSFNPSYFPEVK